MANDNEIQILLIEDNPDEAELVKAMLASVQILTAKIIHVNRLSLGLKRLMGENSHHLSFDVVLLDLNLPDSSGFETFDRLYQQASWVPVVLMTNMDDQELALQAVRRGAQDFLVKTELDPNLLSRSIRYAIERKRVQEALRESEERFTLAVQGANDGLWDWHIKNNHIYFSPRWKSMLGFAEHEIGDRPDEWLDRIHPEDMEDVRLALSAHVKGLSNHFKSEHRIRRKDGAYMWVLTRGLAVRNGGNLAFRMAGSQTDITLRKRTEEQLLYDAFHDSLTGLPNRALFMDRLGRAVKHAQRHQDYRYAVLFLDLDRFKIINDSLGHSFGDKVLNAVADILGHCLRAGDSVARIGGDEFVILLEQIAEIDDAVQISERIQQAFLTPIELEEHKVVISASIGIALGDQRYGLAENILRDADIAMYHAKMLGKACHIVFHPSMRRRAIARMGLESDLRQVLWDDERLERELDVLFQPIVSLNSGRIAGFEALLRWEHPEKGSISPNEFIPIAEETGLIHLLGLWVLRKACQQVSIWQSWTNNAPDSIPISVNVNISGKQFMRPDLVEKLKEITQEFAVAPSSLNLEITESLLMESKEPFQMDLEKIRKLGINLQVDDFGRGYSSYRYLQSFPVNSLKIDSAFIHSLGLNGDNSEIVSSIVGLARSLGMSVIAEGVETETQYQRLKELDCPYVQGYYISRPVSSEKAGELLVQNWQISRSDCTV